MNSLPGASTGIAIACERNPHKQKNHSVFQPAQPEEEHHDLHHVEFEFAGGENQSNQLHYRLRNGDEFPRARSQSAVLVLELLDKMGGLLFAFLVGRDEFLNFHLQLLSVASF